MQCFESEADIYPEVIDHPVDHLVCLYLLTIFTGQKHIRKPFVWESVDLHIFWAPILDGNIHDHLSIKVRDVYGEQYCDRRQDEH